MNKSTKSNLTKPKVFGFFLFAILCIGIILLGYFISSLGMPFCDGIALNLHKLYEGKHTDLNTDFTELIKANTEVLENCSSVSYIKSPKSDVNEWLLDYGIEKYVVSYKCDILSFDTEIYKMGNNLYKLSYSLGPCGKKNVYFKESAENNIGWWVNTKYLFEWDVIKQI